jgi:hypothetical protein
MPRTPLKVSPEKSRDQNQFSNGKNPMYAYVGVVTWSWSCLVSRIIVEQLRE